MRNIALIPARGGSKRLPKKNMLSFFGKPLLEWTIETAKLSGQFSNVIVNTDDEDIRSLSLKLDAEVPGLRPEYLATDYATTGDVLEYTVSNLSYKEDIKSVCVLQPTSPLRTPKDIRDAYHLFDKYGPDAVVSVSEVEHPIEWTCEISHDHRLFNFPKTKFLRSQDYEKKLRLNGSIYLTDIRMITFLGRELYEQDVIGLEIPKLRSADIDTLDDFKIAEFILEHLLKADC